jgi:DOPA 4,5-dioxygenase
MGRVHQKLVGPHPHWSCQLSFDSTQFDKLIPWLEQNRGGLTVLVHGVTGNDLEDHTTNASWLGAPAKLNLEVFGGYCETHPHPNLPPEGEGTPLASWPS